LATVVLGGTIALAAGLLSLPFDPVTSNHGPWKEGTLGSTLDITLSDVPAGYDVMNSTYAGWCMEDNHQDNFPPGTQVTLLDSTDDPGTFPASFQAIDWNKVNYLLNHKAGTAEEVQAALWHVLGTQDDISPALPLTAAAQAMLADANLNGAGFIAGPGQVIAVILYGDGLGPSGFQATLIEVPVPPGDGTGCTPGYWRNHYEDWPTTGLSPANDFDTVFGVNFFTPNITLGQAIWLGGGGVRKVARHGTAALLNSLHAEVDYPFTTDEVINMVRAQDIEPLATANELGCSID